MKKIITLALALIMVLSLAACGLIDTPGKTDSTAAPGTSQQGDTSPADTQPGAQTTAPAATKPVSAPGEIIDFDIGISAIPAEWQKAIGTSMYGMNTGAMDGVSDSYLNKFGGVSADDYAKLMAYFDTLTYVEKRVSVYVCDWGQIQVLHNTDASELTITWHLY